MPVWATLRPSAAWCTVNCGHRITIAATQPW
ncbi:hypothetical protein E2C01_092878 [Portunus trituberculatus]|uniref:Uncharacterized protein n=1 Tax=Portunus trituberculatus TaxID=210409 RepID=A0A5B7JX39_PORTR|nr:hypothetical protein [Portunus trituberculatus]